MLRGRCFCAISSHPIPSPAFQSPLTPLFPLLPGKSSVTPLFPLLTQKQGGGAAEILPHHILFTTDPVHHSIPGGSNRLGNSARSCELSTVDCKLGLLTPSFTTTSINIVGAPTILQRPASEGRALHKKEEPKNRSKDRPLQRRDTGPTGTCALELGGLGG
jgi:hypothetical protein